MKYGEILVYCMSKVSNYFSVLRLAPGPFLFTKLLQLVNNHDKFQVFHSIEDIVGRWFEPPVYIVIPLFIFSSNPS